MKLNYSFRKISIKLLSLCVMIFASSCTIYQGVPDNDGIYTSRKKERKVVVVDRDEYKDYEEDYFTKELERIDRVNGTDIITDIENYNSNDTIPDFNEDIDEYDSGRSWGYDDSDDVVVNVNLNAYGWNRWNAWDIWDPFYYGYGFYNPWVANRFWFGGPRWGIGFGGFYDPWWNGGLFYNPYRFYAFRANRFYNRGRYFNNRNLRYGRRVAYNNVSRRGSTVRRSSTLRRSSSVYRRGSNTNASRRSNNSRVRRSTNSVRRSTNSDSRSRRSYNNSNTRKRSSSSTNRSNRSRRSPSVNRSSRSRSSGNRSSSRSSRSSSRSSKGSPSRRRG